MTRTRCPFPAMLPGRDTSPLPSSGTFEVRASGTWVLGSGGMLSVWETTNQENIHAFATMKMKISNLLVKSISLFRDKSKCESLLSVINSLQHSPLLVSVV